MTQDPAEKPAKKPRKKMEVTDRKRAASSANLAKAREARAKKKAEKLAEYDEDQTIMKELVAEKKAKKKAAVGAPTAVEPVAVPVFGQQPEKKLVKKTHVQLTESEESEESESEASEESSSEDSDVELVLTYAKKGKAKGKVGKEKAAKKSTIMEEMEALKAEIAAMRKQEKKSKPAPVNVYVGGIEKKKKTPAELDVLTRWARDV